MRARLSLRQSMLVERLHLFLSTSRSPPSVLHSLSSFAHSFCHSSILFLHYSTLFFLLTDAASALHSGCDSTAGGRHLRSCPAVCPDLPFAVAAAAGIPVGAPEAFAASCLGETTLASPLGRR
eukprot:GHVU01103218.1.p3 GENE.GHVU01103218.1~~GHVU01103218.1.p3  ORF type:complete len:123 (-),score=6.00 GHVU01103218.1:247-615(-)